MSTFNTSGTVYKISEAETITKKDGSKTWQKLTFVTDNKDKYNNFMLIEVFGDEAVSQFQESVKVGDFVNCEVQASASRFVKDDVERFFPKVGLIKCNVSSQTEPQEAPQAQSQGLGPQDDLPF